MLARPTQEEYFEFYRRYVDQVSGDDILAELSAQPARIVETLSSVDGAFESYAYAPGKWTVREVLGHITDTERVFSYRALTIGRGDDSPLPAFDENGWAARSNAGSRQLSALLDEFVAVRASTVALYRSFDQEIGKRRGTASGRTVSVRALAWISVGHAEHHLTLLKDRYGAAVSPGPH